MIKVLPYASSGVTLDTTCSIEIQYVPAIYNKVSLYRTCEALLEETDTVSGGKASKELQVIQRKLAMVENTLGNLNVIHKSSDFQYYDPIYGVNRKRLSQDFYKNNYIGSYGWD